MINSLILAVPVLIILAVVLLGSLPPRMTPFSPEELKETAEYHNRMNRRGVYNSPLHTPVISVGSAQEKRILIMGPRRWA